MAEHLVLDQIAVDALTEVGRFDDELLLAPDRGQDGSAEAPAQTSFDFDV